MQPPPEPGKRCPRCRTYAVHRSHFRAWELPLALVLCRPFRCHTCLRRFWRPLVLWPLSGPRPPA